MKTTTRFEPRRFFISVINVFLCIILASKAVNAQPQLSYTSLTQDLSAPVNVTNAADETGRIFITEQSGKVKILKNGSMQSKPFIDLSNIVRYSDRQGLWNITFAPGYKKNKTFFVLYNDRSGATVIARYRASKQNPDSADMNSGVIVLRMTDYPAFGDMHFGQDRNLYITLNDGSDATRITERAQNLKSYFGKLLRIDVSLVEPPYYTIPPDNPFINTPNALKEIFAYGLRAGWRWSFDRRNSNLWLTDVGDNQLEEVNVRTINQVAGYNYGWPCYEGDISFISTDCNNTSDYVFPNFSYPHNNSTGGKCIIGGYVYRGRQYPSLKGYYICSDFISNNAWKIRPDGKDSLTTYLQKEVPPGIVSYGEDEKGELYAVSYYGQLYSIGATATAENISGSLPAQTDKIDEVNNRAKIYPTLIRNNKFTAEISEGFTNLEVYNVSGSKVYSRKLDGRKASINITLPQLETGIYFVHLSGTQYYRQKIFISK